MPIILEYNNFPLMTCHLQLNVFILPKMKRF